MEKIIIRQIPVGSLQVLTYFVVCPQTREAVIIDPAGEVERISALIEEEGFKIKYILNSHGHGDHVLANRELEDSLSVPTCMHEMDDQFFLQKEVR